MCAALFADTLSPLAGLLSCPEFVAIARGPAGELQVVFRGIVLETVEEALAYAKAFQEVVATGQLQASQLRTAFISPDGAWLPLGKGPSGVPIGARLRYLSKGRLWVLQHQGRTTFHETAGAALQRVRQLHAG